MSFGKRSSEYLQKPGAIRYSGSWDVEFSRNLGAYSFFHTNKQYERAYWNLWLTVLSAIKDKQRRVFKVISEKQSEVDKYEAEFILKAYKFAMLFGVTKKQPEKFSYLDLRPREKPKPDDDKVYISRMVRFYDFWGKYDYEYIVYRVRFIYVKKKINAAGFTIDEEHPLVDYSSPKTLLKYRTNVLPYTQWETENRISISLCTDAAKDLEEDLSYYVFNNKDIIEEDTNAESAGSMSGGVYSVDLSRVGPGGYDYPGAVNPALPKPDDEQEPDPAEED